MKFDVIKRKKKKNSELFFRVSFANKYIIHDTSPRRMHEKQCMECMGDLVNVDKQSRVPSSGQICEISTLILIL